MHGCIHIYTGDGKGKTTASVGLAVRFAGRGGNVLFSQFLKDGSSGEIRVLSAIPNITVKSCTEKMGFSFYMNEEEKQHAAIVYDNYLKDVLDMAVKEEVGLLVLDEVISVYNLEFIGQQRLLDFLEQKPDEMEVVLTGRDPAEELVELADYVSEICKRKHPFDQGIAARVGIEH